MVLYDKVSLRISKLVTTKYSTSFSLGIKMFHKDYRYPIYAIYGLVRVADEIVDTFHNVNKKKILDELRQETFLAIKEGMSTNPIVHSFQYVVNKYKIDNDLIEAFFHSMEFDIYKNSYSKEEYDKYVFGSAEVIGLMCLKIFVDGDDEKYNSLKPYARSLGSAFQKVNFLRDIRSDLYERKRIYIPDVHQEIFINDENKKKLESETEKEFEKALNGIKRLPSKVKLGVYLAYLYYKVLLDKIKRSSVKELTSKRFRVSDFIKLILMFRAFVEVRVLRLI